MGIIMHHRISLLLSIILLLCQLWSCTKENGEKDVLVTSVSLSQSAAKILIGDSFLLMANVQPSNATDKTVVWASSKQSVATVTDGGFVIALAEGTSTITATVGGIQATCIVSVSPKRVTSIHLDKKRINIAVGDQEAIKATAYPNDAEDVSIRWNSSDESIAIVNNGVITAIGKGEANIIASNDSVEAICSVTVFEASVDLGLSVRWATRNIGAKLPEEYGSLFAWGEIVPKKVFTWENYKWRKNEYLTKYVTDSKYGEVDNKTQLDFEDDVAIQLLGGNWRMPTYEEINELRDNCTFKWEEQHGFYGATLVSKVNGNSIFLPAPLYHSEYGDVPLGQYWSSSLVDSTSAGTLTSGLTLMLWQYYNSVGSRSRQQGLSIRPVYAP